ncbi:uncharacterized protein LOC116249275 [Nymphaea colorata]|nr:uncharacterized protein LOC116249275 [Nymphaea colorata]
MDSSHRPGDAQAADLSASTTDDYVHVPPPAASGEPDETLVPVVAAPSEEQYETVNLIADPPSGEPDSAVAPAGDASTRRPNEGLIRVDSARSEPEEEGAAGEPLSLEDSESEEAETEHGYLPSEEDPRELVDLGGWTGENVKFELPPELTKNVVFLECESSAPGGVCRICLVGTAHVSKESCDEVQAIINLLKPQVVFLELCSNRVAFLSPNVQQVQSLREMVDIWKKGEMNLFGLLYSWFFSKVANQLEVTPGAEFRTAYEAAISYGARVILGDRPIKVTLRRTWGLMPLWQKIKLLLHMFFQGICLPGAKDLNDMLKAMGDVDMFTFVVQEMSKSYPTFMETIVHERDRYMSHTLLRVASSHNSVVGVVGKGHLPGIKEHWKQPIEMSDLLAIPESISCWSSKKLWTTVGIAVVGVAVASGYFLASKR